MSRRAVVLGELADRVEALRVARPVRVAVDGPDATGKTMLAGELAVVLRNRGRVVVVVSVDDFPRPVEERYARGRDSAEGYYRDAVDEEALLAAVHRPTDPGTVVLCEGIFLLRPELRDLWDLSVVVTAPFETRLQRALARDVPRLGSRSEVERRYRTRYEPGQQLYQAEADAEQTAADIVVDNSDPASPVMHSRPEKA